jgi:hypothetical protein
MKEILLFIKWQWNKWEFWQKCFMFGAFFFGMGLGLPKPYQTYVLAVPLVIFFMSTFKWFVWDGVVNAWKSYKKEKSEMFSVIKGE